MPGYQLCANRLQTGNYKIFESMKTLPICFIFVQGTVYLFEQNVTEILVEQVIKLIFVYSVKHLMIGTVC